MNWKGKKVLVIGDVMLDKYLFGKVERVSPEAPVPVVAVERERYVPGGAANAANNVACLGGDAVLVGIVGNDLAKEILADEVKKRGIHARFIVDPSSPTIQKIRVLNGSQQVARIDYEDTAYADEREVEAMVEHIMRQEVDAILVSDYAKGTITQALLLDIKALAKKKGIPLLIDPKPKHKLWYKGCTLITPNKKEAEEMVGYSLSSKEEIERAGKALTQELDCHVLLTLGEKGMSLFEKGKP
ncbi:MAG: PfkB family carbohydrate kinase, partial [Nanoarchaeota archaeon]|nr:PfkB family carbohydrate kinase [Nanoarchaeota archaeon]